MDDALANWLALREPTDFASRSRRLTERIAAQLAGRDPLRVLDLGTGAGSNLRYLVDRLPARHQQWLVVDRSATLLSLVRERTAAAAVGRDRQIDLDTRERDLNDLDDAALFAGRDLVTASALLDLVSGSWLQTLARHCAKAGAAALFTLTYNGRSVCSPAEPEDALVLDLFNRHQHRDKGLGGPAAGPDATDAAARAFEAVRYTVDIEASDWVLGPADAAMQRELIEGWAFAATETDPAAAGTIAGWKQRRLAHVEAGRSQATVGHYDLAAFR